MEEFILIVRTCLMTHICLGVVKALNPYRAMIEALRLSKWSGWAEAEFFFENEDVAMEYIHTRGNCWMENSYAGLPVVATYLSNHNGAYLVVLKLNEFNRIFNIPSITMPALTEHYKIAEVACSN